MARYTPTQTFVQQMVSASDRTSAPVTLDIMDLGVIYGIVMGICSTQRTRVLVLMVSAHLLTIVLAIQVIMGSRVSYGIAVVY